MGQARERDGRGRPPVWQGCRVLAEIFVMNWQSADSLTADPRRCGWSGRPRLPGVQAGVLLGRIAQGDNPGRSVRTRSQGHHR